MRFSRPMPLIPLVLVAVLSAACSSSEPDIVLLDDSEFTTTTSTTIGASSSDDGSSSSEEAATTTSLDEDEAEPGAFITAASSCLETPVFLQNLPRSEFVVLTEDKIFECLGVESFQSEVTFDGELPAGPATVLAASTQRLEDGVLSARGTFAQDGVITEELLRVGDDAWELDEAGDWVPVELGLSQLFNEEGEIRLGMTGALYMLSVFGGGAEAVGEDLVGGRTVTRWEADAASIETWVNGLGISPVPIGLNDGSVVIWATEDGLIVKLDAEIRAADVTVAGLPVDQVDPAALGLPADALDIVPDYAMTYELFDFDHDIVIEAPTGG